MSPLGRAFPDFIKWERQRRPRKNESEEQSTSSRPWRLFFLMMVFLSAFIILEARLFNLTIAQGSRFRFQSEGNRIREETIPAPRGIIFDRNNQPMLRNIPLYKERLSDCGGEVNTCERSISAAEARRRMAGGEGKNLSYRIGREYILGVKAAHLVGYLGELTEEEQKARRYHPGDLVGRGGIEEAYDSALRGVDGKELVEVDARGERLRTLGKLPEIPGSNIDTTIDSKLQELAAETFANRSGAIVVTIPHTGEVLALFSAPSFDPNLFTLPQEDISLLFKSPNSPLFNRATSGVYPPGSVFKIVTATAALEEGKISTSTKIDDTGVLSVGPYRFHNWYFTQYGKTEGLVDIYRAIARSNDIFFYHVGERVGSDLLAKWAKSFGLGTKNAIDLPGEAAGLVPDSVWKKSALSQDWFLGDSYHYAIGQGYLLTTPLQINTLTNGIATKGKICEPRIAKQATRNCRDFGAKKETIEVIKEGMRQACSPGGTGWPLFKFKIKNEKLKIDEEVEIPIACKTGTAEYGDSKGRTHAWITAFAPIEDPQISVTVLVEGGGEGSSVAGPIAKKIFEEWFKR